MMTLLLDRRGDQITVTEEIVKSAVGNELNGKATMTLLVHRWESRIIVTEEMVRLIAEHFDKEAMTLLLDRHGDKITVTEEVVKAAARNERYGKRQWHCSSTGGGTGSQSPRDGTTYCWTIR